MKLASQDPGGAIIYALLLFIPWWVGHMLLV
jgi:hypothetical protein